MPGKQKEPENMEARKRSYIFPSQAASESTGHEAAPEPIPAQSAMPVPAEKEPDPITAQKQETLEQSGARQGSYVFSAQPTAEPANPEAAPVSGSIPREPEMPQQPKPAHFQASQDGLRVPAVESPDPRHPRRKLNWAIWGGVAVFAVVIAALLVSGLLHQNVVLVGSPAIESSIPEAVSSNAPVPSSPPASSSTPPAQQKQELTLEQQSMLDTLAQKFPEVVLGLTQEVTKNDKVFLAAAQSAFYTDPVFDEYGLTVMLMLPDPRTSSLDKMGIEPYTPNSDAQAYIRDNYAKLCRMEGITDWLEYSMTFHFQEIGDEKTLKWDTFPISSALWEYSQVFAPHIDQYMADMGFDDAAIELLMPMTGTWRDSADLGSDNMGQYFSDLADALEFEGVEIDGQTVVSHEVIEEKLKARMAQIWMCDSVSVYTSVFREPQLKMRSLSSGPFFSKVLDGLKAQYESGSLTMPPTYEELEAVFLSTAQKMSEGLLESTAAKNQELIMDRDYPFDWESLGNAGIAACPELVDDVRRFMFSYDFDLMFLAPYEMSPR